MRISDCGFRISDLGHLPPWHLHPGQVWRAVPGLRISDHVSRFTFHVLSILIISLFISACEYQTISGGPGSKQATQPAAKAKASATPLKAPAQSDSAAQGTVVQCRLADLTPTATWSQSDKGMAGELTLTNYWKTTCTLRGQPELGIMDERGAAYPLTVTEPPAGSLQTASWAFKPGTSGSVRFYWRNWCGPAPVGTLRVTVALPGQAGPSLYVVVEDPNGKPILVTPRCENDKQPSTLIVEGLRLVN